MTRKEFLLDFVSSVYGLDRYSLGYSTGYKKNPSCWGHVKISTLDCGDIAIFHDRDHHSPVRYTRIKWNPLVHANITSVEADSMEIRANVFLQQRDLPAIAELINPRKPLYGVARELDPFLHIVSFGCNPWQDPLTCMSPAQIAAFERSKYYRLWKKWSHFTEVWQPFYAALQEYYETGFEL